MQRSARGATTKPGGAVRLKVGIAAARFNEDITEALLRGAREVIRAWGVKESNVHVLRVYGSFELPFACQRLIKKHKVGAVIALGCIVKGETRHDEYLAHAVLNGLQRVSLETGVPVGLGVLTTNTLAQARARSRGRHDHGAQAAQAALEAALAA